MEVVWSSELLEIEQSCDSSKKFLIPAVVQARHTARASRVHMQNWWDRVRAGSGGYSGQ